MHRDQLRLRQFAYCASLLKRAYERLRAEDTVRNTQKYVSADRIIRHSKVTIRISQVHISVSPTRAAGRKEGWHPRVSEPVSRADLAEYLAVHFRHTDLQLHLR